MKNFTFEILKKKRQTIDKIILKYGSNKTSQMKNKICFYTGRLYKSKMQKKNKFHIENVDLH